MTQVATVQVEPFKSWQMEDARRMLTEAGWQPDALPTPDVLRTAAEEGMAFIARLSNDQIVGFARIISDRVTVSYLAEIVVDPEWQKHGAGKALADACAERFPTARLDLLSTADAQPFYERVGCRPKPGYRRWPQ